MTALSFDRFLSSCSLPKLDGHAEIDRDLAHRIAEILEAVVRIAPRIADDDAAAAPADHLVEAQVLEMPSVREIDVMAVVRRQPEHLAR